MKKIAYILFGPPAIGKSRYVKEEIKDNDDAQIVNIDKDVINTYFFSPTLLKLFKGVSPTDILWKTTEKLVEELIEPSYIDLLESTSEKRELVVFLQGVTMGGVDHDMEKLLSAGFEINFILLTTNDPEILHRRIVDRASNPNFVGAPPMPSEKLSESVLRCNKEFLDLFLKNVTPETTTINSFKSNHKSPNVPKKFNFLVDLTTVANITTTQLLTSREIYTEDEIKPANNGTIILGNSHSTAVLLVG